jgi:hypothetical protein
VLLGIANDFVVSANVEISRVRNNNENELALVRAKLQKAELQIKSLENVVETKKSENAELMGICDELIKKMEGRSDPPSSSTLS